MKVKIDALFLYDCMDEDFTEKQPYLMLLSLIQKERRVLVAGNKSRKLSAHVGYGVSVPTDSFGYVGKPCQVLEHHDVSTAGFYTSWSIVISRG
jgi:hypothetical protein